MTTAHELAAGTTRSTRSAGSSVIRLPLASLRNLWAGLKLATFVAVDAREFHVSVPQILVLAALQVALIAAHDYLRAAPQHYFSIYGVTHLATFFLLLLLSVFSITALQRASHRSVTMLLIILAAHPLLFLVDYAQRYVFEEAYELLSRARYVALGWALWLALTIWYVAVIGRVVKIVLAPRASRLALLVAIFAAFNVAPVFVIGEEALFYGYAESPEEDVVEDTIDVERIYYSQPALVESAVQELSMHRPGEVDLYFVGFAPYAEQDVFMREVRYVRALFDSRFDTAGRSLNLINNAETVDRVALANTMNLRTVLHAVAERMDIEEDILFLFLTSHGSRDGVLSVSFWPLAPRDLSATELADMLDEIGIKWRIVVISACYSGSFIEALENDHSLILTAASEDRNSFGCSNDRELTYFGEHFFARELSAGAAFAQAFERARESIRERELREEREPSRPQMRMGAEMADKLAAFETRIGR